MKVIKLENTFTGTGEVKGFTFECQFESVFGYIYRVDTGSSVHYEVFRKKTVPTCIDFANKIFSETERKEIYPKAKHFGVWAWSKKSYAEAEAKLFSI